jgi:hypothetical protein
MRRRLGLLLLVLGVDAPVAAQSPADAPTAEIPAVAENLLSFDPATLTLRWENSRWLLVAGEQLLKDFGPRQNEARQALRLLQDLNLNQYGTVGSPRPILEYWLADGQAPARFTPGLRRLTMDPATLRVEQMQAQWCLRDARMVFFNFGFHQREAEQALAIIAKYGFTDIGILGGAQPALFIFFAPCNGLSPSARAAPTSHIRKASYQPENPNPERSRINVNPGGGLGAIVTPALPPLRNPSPHGPRLAFGRDSLADSRHGAARFGNAAPPLPGWEDRMECVPFNWRQVRMHQENGVWQLVAGECVLASFGADEEAARQALSVLHYYHFTEQYRLGHPEPLFTFFLINGQPPLGLPFGLSGLAFQPDHVSVQQLGRNWSLCEGDRVLVMLDDKEEGAQQLLDVIRLHKFDRLCRIGGMTFFARAR